MKPFAAKRMKTMHTFRREAEHKLRVLKHVEAVSDVGRAYRYFGVGRASFCRWKAVSSIIGAAPGACAKRSWVKSAVW